LQPILERSFNGSSAGALGITANNAAENLDFSTGVSQLPNLILGAGTAGIHYTGILTPNNNIYRLGNANQLQIDSKLTDGPGAAPRSVVISGSINFQQASANAYTGGTSLQAGGVLNFRAGTLSTGD